MSEATSISGPAAPPAHSAETILIFRLAGEAFALAVDGVQEILDPIAATAVPGASAFAPALLNVRGAVVPLLDLRHRLGMPTRAGGASEPPAGSERIIVLDAQIADEAVRLAVRADAVEEVVETDAAELTPIPELGARWPARFVRGVARRDASVVVLLDAATLFEPDFNERAAS